jgi:hypothetical protein
VPDSRSAFAAAKEGFMRTVFVGGILGVTLSLLIAACSSSQLTPTAPTASSGASGSQVAPASGQTATQSIAGPPWGPETPNFNLEVQLRGDGFGLVNFRQPNDGTQVVFLDVWVRDLEPNTSYRLQIAVDGTLDGNCTSTQWLTLGSGSTPQAILTDGRGTGRAELSRDLNVVPPGAMFEIHFRVINDATGVVALTSACYQPTVSQG